jgi:hypothetical protein
VNETSNSLITVECCISSIATGMLALENEKEKDQT